MAGAPVRDVILSADAEAEQGGGIDLAFRNGDDLDRAGQSAGHARQRAIERGGIKEIAFVQHDEIGACDLIREHFLHRIVVLERGIRCALARKRFHICRDLPRRDGCAVDHRHHAIDRNPATDCGPMEGLNQRLRQRQAGGFDHDVLHGGAAGQDRIESRHKLVRHGAAQAAIGELDNVLLRTSSVAAAFEDFAVDTDVAELVDDHGQPPALRVAEDVADQRGLSGAEEARDDGARHAGERIGHRRSPAKSNGGVRATRPRFRASGRPRHGISPSGAPAKSFAPSISASAPAKGSRLPNT